MQDQIPKYLALNQKSDAMYDQRVADMKNQIKPSQKALAFTSKLKSNKVLDYSNKHGLMVYCSENDIGFKDLQDLNSEFTTGNFIDRQFDLRLQETPNMLIFSPDESLLATVLNTKILVFQTLSAKQKKPPVHSIPLDSPITDINWTKNDGILFWQYNSEAKHYSFSTSRTTVFHEIKCCSAQLINKHFILTQQFNVFVYDLNYNRVNTVTYPDQTYKSDNFYGINMEDVISIVKITNLQSEQFREDDVYAFITVFCQIDVDEDDDTIPPNKYLFFARGDIRTQNVQFGGGYLLYHNNNDESQYIEKADGKQRKRGFSVKSYVQPKINLLVFSIERSQQIYGVKTNTEFSNLKLIDFPGKYQFRFDGFVAGFALLKNMLQFELEYSGESKDLKTVTEKFQGRFMNIGIKERDKDMFVPFPLSVLSWNHKGVQNKQYFVITQAQIDAEDTQEKKYKKMAEMIHLSPMITLNNENNQAQEKKKLSLQQPNSLPKTEKASQPKPTEANQPNIWSNSIGSKPPDPSGTETKGVGPLFDRKPNIGFIEEANLIGKPLFFNPPSTMTIPGTANTNFNLFSSNPSSTGNIFSKFKPQANLKVQNKLNLGSKTQNKVQIQIENPQEVQKNAPPNVIVPQQPPPISPNPLGYKIVPSPFIPVNEKNPAPKLDQPIVKIEQPKKVQQIIPNQKVQIKKQQVNQKQKEIASQQQDQLQQITKYITSESDNFINFLNFSKKQKKQDLRPVMVEAPIQQEMITFLDNLKKQEQILNMGILQARYLTENSSVKRNRSKILKIQFGSITGQSKAAKLEDIIREKLNRFDSHCQKITHMKRRFVTQNIPFMKVNKPASKAAQIEKVLTQQNKKIQGLEEKVNAFYKQHKQEFERGSVKNQFMKFVQKESEEDQVGHACFLQNILKKKNPQVIQVDTLKLNPIVDLRLFQIQMEKQRQRYEQDRRNREKIQRMLDSVKSVERVPKAERNRIKFDFDSQEEKSEHDEDGGGLLLDLPEITAQISSKAQDLKSDKLFGLGSPLVVQSTEKPLIEKGAQKSSEQKAQLGEKKVGGLFAGLDNKPTGLGLNIKAQTGSGSLFANLGPSATNAAQTKTEKKPFNLFEGLSNKDNPLSKGQTIFNTPVIKKEQKKEQQKKQAEKPSQPPLLFPSQPPKLSGNLFGPAPSVTAPKQKSSDPLSMSDIKTGLLKTEEDKQKAQTKKLDIKLPSNPLAPAPEKKDGLFPVSTEKKVNIFGSLPVNPSQTTQQTNDKLPNPLNTAPKTNVPPTNPPNSIFPNQPKPASSIFPTSNPPPAPTNTSFLSNTKPQIPPAPVSMGPTGGSGFGVSTFGNKPSQLAAPPSVPPPSIQPNQALFNTNQAQMKAFGSVSNVSGNTSIFSGNASGQASQQSGFSFPQPSAPMNNFPPQQGFSSSPPNSFNPNSFNANSFGQNSFGQNSQNSFGQNLFGTNSNQNTNIFGQSTTVTPPNNQFVMPFESQRPPSSSPGLGNIFNQGGQQGQQAQSNQQKPLSLNAPRK